MVKTLLYLQEHSLMDCAELEKTCDAAVQKYNSLSSRTKAANERMKEISELQRYIGTYGKTREVYAQYKKLPPKKQQQFYADHTGEIISCEAAKRYFDSLGLKKLPSMQSLKQEYATLLAENKNLYPEQKKAKAEMMELLTAKHNVMRILGLVERNAQRDRHQEER